VNVNTTGTTNTTSTTNTTTTTNPTGINININDKGISMTGIGTDINVQTTGTNVNTQTQQTSTTTNSSNVVSSDNSSRFVNNGVMCSSPTLSPEQLVKLKLEIDQRSYVTKMNLAKENVRRNCMQSSQVAELVRLFDYESDQLELAKFAYQYTYDTKNYDLVVNALKHDFNKPKLLEVIGSSGSSTSTTTVNTTGTTNVNTTNVNNNSTTTTTTTVVEKKVVTNSTPTTTSSGGCITPMSDADFSNAKNSIQSKSFEDSKMTLAKQVTKNKCLSVKQIKEIMLLFSFEQSRLDFAKFAYDFASDRDNYYQLNDAFTFESSISDLNEYIESK
jgi:hypothetical protein